MEPQISRRQLLKYVAPLAGAAALGLSLPTFIPSVSGSTASPQETANYIIYQSGTTINRKNGTTGLIDDSGTDASTVISNAIAAMSSYQRLVVIGDMTINSEITLNKSITYDHFGKAILATPAGQAYLNLNGGTVNSPVSEINVFVRSIDGQLGSGTLRNGVKGTQAIQSHVRVGSIVNCDVGIRLDSPTSPCFNNFFDFDIIRECNLAIYTLNAQPSGNAGAKEGNVYRGTVLHALGSGLVNLNGNNGGSAFFLQIDNALNTAADDFVNNQSGALGIFAILYGNVRANRTLVQLKDFVIYSGPVTSPGGGSVKVTAYTESTKPAFNAVPPGTIILSTDAPSGQRFQGSNGAAWLPLG